MGNNASIPRWSVSGIAGEVINIGFLGSIEILQVGLANGEDIFSLIR